MHAVVLEERGIVNNREVPDPQPGPGHVIMRVEAVSICGSDISRYTKGHRTYPIILGHECAGVVSAVGEGVDGELVGRRSALVPLVPCFRCEQCLLGHYSACHSYSFIGSRQAGGFADYVELPATNLFLLPAEVSFDEGALVEPSTVARHILALGDFRAGQSAMVFGAGSIGLMLVQWLRILGAGLIVCSDIVEENLEVARRLGAHVALNAMKTDVQEEVRKVAGDGVDLALEAAGAPQTLLQTIAVARPRGSVVCAGNQPLDASLPMSFIENMMRKELRINGCFMSYSAPFPGSEWTDTLEAILNGSLDVEAMISHRFPLSQAPEVFRMIGEHTLTHRKIVFHPNQGPWPIR